MFMNMIPGLTDSIKQDIHKLNRFIIRVGNIHIGHKELSSTSSMEYQKAGLALIEQGVSDTLCSLDQDLISWEILEQVEVFFHYLDRHVIDDIGFRYFKADALSDRALDLPAGILSFLNNLLSTADAQETNYCHALKPGKNGTPLLKNIRATWTSRYSMLFESDYAKKSKNENP